MREILFRGKRADIGEWVYGDLRQYSETSKGILDYKLQRIVRGILPETVGQFTGLTDKNGTKIFEGDIVLVGGVQKAKISFENGCFRVSYFALNILCDRKSECEVIGNIHDNPELLGGDS